MDGSVTGATPSDYARGDYACGGRSMSDGELLIDEGPITRLTLNRPERHNALSVNLGDQVMDALYAAGQDTTVKAVILKGAARSFCTGDDGRADKGYHDPAIEAVSLERHPYFQLMSMIRRVPKPVIAQVHGYCLGLPWTCCWRPTSPSPPRMRSCRCSSAIGGSGRPAWSSSRVTSASSS